MKKVLWVSLFIPYDEVRHAGGKIHNFYLKQLEASGQFDIRLLTFAEVEDLEKHDLDKYGIQHDIICYDSSRLWMIMRKVINAESTYNPYNRYGRALQNYDILMVHRKVREYANSGYYPDVIILQWTQIVFMLPFIKKYYPQAAIIAIEEDVTYLSYERKMKYYPRMFLRYISRKSFKKVKKLELEALKRADLIVTNNEKDKGLIVNEGINEDKVFVWTPFFQNYIDIERKCSNHNIVFYGGMGRQENYLSAIWFAENVMPKLQDTDVVFQIVGANPNQQLYEYESEKVVIVGFVEHIEKYLSTSLCLVAPLVFGAGVKIKVLEAMSAGIPVLTNEVGIEGINAKEDDEFFRCITKEDYEKYIRKLLAGQINMQNMERREKRFIKEHYDLERSVKEFISNINALQKGDHKGE